ncbi:MAG: carboxypeptidase-like regulatory domain-containing protein [Bacteroidales bacterium]|nr:MAG: carboxypeptidase-like regulatory domain-containing protein [Bacteroidales bacterium]
MIRKEKIISLLTFLVVSSHLSAQLTSTLTGIITDTLDNPLHSVNITVSGTGIGTSSDQDGKYHLQVPANRDLTIVFSMVGYEPKKVVIRLVPGEEKKIDVILFSSVKELREVQVTGLRARTDNFVRLELKDFRGLPNLTGNIEAVLKTLPGVSSSTELSSQYSVRGGNFDENLVYVNDIEIYRPFLIRSGQQEGLSFVNSDMVASLQFSAGGFNASYGDKMSSVLDIKYRQPESLGGTVSASMLGGAIHLEGISRNAKFTHATGIRYKTTQYLLKTFDTEGDYKPVFTDLQTYMTYTLPGSWKLSFLGNYSSNNYRFVPQDRRTSFGTITDAVQLYVLYDGQEVDKFITWQGALSADYRPNDNLALKFIASSFHTTEEETFDIQGRYSLNALDKELGSENLGDSIMNIGIGRFLNHARNFLDASVISVSHKGHYYREQHHVQWGLRYRNEFVRDNLNEWKLIDSAGFSIPYSDTEVLLAEIRLAENRIQSNRITAYFQDSYGLPFDSLDLHVTGGLRMNYWDFNGQMLISPRMTITYQPKWKRDITFRLSTGYYYQPPFYKEIRTPDGELNKGIKAQKSVHFVLGSELHFTAWERPFIFTSEIYYKILQKLIPYKIDNVRIDYSGINMARGYATGIDLKLNGEFVPGIESWASLSFMQTKEDIIGDHYIDSENGRYEPGYYPRPTDQLVNFGLFFQDYFPTNPSYTVHLSLLFGTGLPTSSPYSNRYDRYFRMPSYRRVDIGLSKVINNPAGRGVHSGFFRSYESIWLGLEVFNLFGINNTISYLWLTTVNNLNHISHQYAVPNYLTSRRLNLRISLKF